MSVAFTTIAGGIRTNTNHAEFDSSRAVTGALVRQHKILGLGIRLSTGTAAALELKQVLSGDQGEVYHGVGSMLGEMVRYGKKANGQTEFWSIGINALGGGTAGAKTLTFTGPASAQATLALYIAGRYVAVGIASGDAASAIATKVNAAIQAHPEYMRMPFTSAVVGAVVTLTMRWAGVDVADVRVNYNSADQLPAGVGVVIATSVVGAGNPDIQAILTAIGDVTQYDTILMPFTDAPNLTALETELAERWGGMSQIDGHAFAAVHGTHGVASTLGSSRNSKHICVQGTNLSPTPPWIWAAVFGVVDAFERDPARPRQTLPLPGILPAVSTALWGQADRNLLLYDGIATHVVDPGGNVTLGRSVTTYQVNAQGVPDTAYLDVETLRSLSFIRYDGNASVSLAYPRCKLAKDGAPTPPGQPIMTPSTMRGHLGSRYDIWAGLGVVEAGSKQRFMDELIVEIDPTDPNRLVAQGGPDLMNQFRGMSIQWQYIV